MQTTNTVAAFYHLELTKVNSNAQSDLSNTPAIISPPFYNLMFSSRTQALPPVRSNTHDSYLVSNSRPDNFSPCRYRCFQKHEIER